MFSGWVHCLESLESYSAWEKNIAALSLQGVVQNTAYDVMLCNYTLPHDCIVNTVSDYKVIA